MRILLLNSLFFLFLNLSGQGSPAFIPLDDKNIKGIESMFIDQDGKMYYINVEKYMGFAIAGLNIGKWNGQFHSKLPVYVPSNFYYGDNNRSALCLFNDTLYVAGPWVNSTNSTNGIQKWNGQNWESVAGGIWSDYPIHPEFSVSDMAVFNEQLYVSGSFNQTKEGACNGFIRLNANIWENIALDGKVTDMEIIGDSLFVSGLFTTIEGTNSPGLSCFSQGNWLTLLNPGIGTIKQLGKYKGHLIAIGETGVKMLMQGLWIDLSDDWDYSIIHNGSSVEFNGSFFLSGVLKGSDGKIHHLLEWNGQTWIKRISEEHVTPRNGKRFHIGSGGTSLYFGGTMKTLFNQRVNHAVELFPNHSIIKGRLYKDNNQNCQFDAGDIAIPNAILSLDHGKYYTSTNTDGFYELALSPQAMHTLTVFPEAQLSVHCSSETIQVQTLNRDTFIFRDFAFIDKPLPPEETIYLSSDRGFKVKHGYDANYTVKFNTDAFRYPFYLKLTYNPDLLNFQCEHLPLENQGGQVIWKIDSPDDLKFSLNINPIKFSIGDRVDFDLEAHNADWRLGHHLSQEVVAAYDPNDKQCSESRIGTGTRNLDYRVGFQNLGNDEAYDVYVVDTISRTIPLQFLKVRDFSHKNKYSVNFKVRDHAVIWGFNDINLGAKSIVGDELSSGFISFNTGLENNLQIGDSILNRAAIYFDFQPPVFTNTTVTEVVTYSQPGNQNGLKLQLFPNPNRGTFHLNLEPYNILKAEVYDLTGRLISVTDGRSSGSLDILMSGLSKGLYVVKVHHALGVISKQFVVLD